MPSILIVDDEPDVRELFNITLSMAGHATTTARDGLEAVEHLKTLNPDLIVLDLMMPRLDGFGLLERMRTEMAARPMRVLIATAKTIEEHDQQKLTGWPIVGVLNKGQLDISRMVSIVSAALSREAANPNPPPVVVTPPPAAKAPGTAPLVEGQAKESEDAAAKKKAEEEAKAAEAAKPAIQPIPPESTAPTIQANRSDLARRLEEAARQARAAMTAQTAPPPQELPKKAVEEKHAKKDSDDKPATSEAKKPDTPPKT